MTPGTSKTFIFFHFRLFSSVTKKSRFSVRFTYENEGCVGSENRSAATGLIIQFSLVSITPSGSALWAEQKARFIFSCYPLETGG